MNHRIQHLAVALILGALTLFSTSSQAANGAPPDLMSYQGFLVDNSGTPLGNASPENKTIQFRIYNQSSSGSIIWSEEQVVTVDKGYFNVLLGQGTAIGSENHDPISGAFASASGSDRYIGITVDGAEISPRLQLIASPYSFLARSANQVVGTDGVVGVSSGANGKVGIGTANPTANLDVKGLDGVGAPVLRIGGASSELFIVSDLTRMVFFTRDSAGVNGNRDFMITANGSTTGGITINKNGNFGVGTGSPSKKLHVNGDVQATKYHGDGSALTGVQATGIANNAINSAKIANNTITKDDIGTAAVGSDEIQNESVKSEDILNGTITGADLKNDTITYTQIGTGAVGSGEIIDGQVKSVDIENGTIATVDLKNGAVTKDKLGDEAVTSSKIKDGTITGSDIDNGTITSSDISSSYALWNKSGNDINWTAGKVRLGSSTALSQTAQATLHIEGNEVNSTHTFGSRYRGQPAGSAPDDYNSTTKLDIFTKHAIGSSAFFAISDRRIKSIRGKSDSSQDLATLSCIEITDYRHVDPNRGDRPQKKVIAQQVKEHYPQAVSLLTGIVPDIYQLAEVSGDWISLKTDLKPGERVKIITEDNRSSVQEVIEVKENGFRTGLKTTGKQLFVYGREVDDFHQVDYDALSMLNVSATQEIHRRLKVAEKTVAKQESELDALRKKVTELEAQERAREGRLAKLERLLESLSGSAALQSASLSR